MPEKQQTKKCPYCAEEIQAEAIKCRYCGEFLEGTGDINDQKQKEQKVIRIIPCEIHKTGTIEEYVFEEDSMKVLISYQGDSLTLNVNDKIEATINEKGSKYVTDIKGKESLHKLSMWYEKRTGIFSILNFWEEEGVGIEVDNVPVQGTLADPFTIIKNGKNALWVFFAFLLLKAVIGPFFTTNGDIMTNIIVSMVIYGLPASLLLFYGIKFNRYIKPAIWVSLVIGILETIDFIYGGISTAKIGIMTIVFGAIRLSALYFLFKSVSLFRSVEF